MVALPYQNYDTLLQYTLHSAIMTHTWCEIRVYIFCVAELVSLCVGKMKNQQKKHRQQAS